MRYIGILLMAGTLIVGGFSAAEQYRERVEVLGRLRQMVYHLKNQILYANAALSTALAETGARFEGETAAFFHRTARRLQMEKAKEVSEIWKEEAEKLFQRVPMGKQDRENLLALGRQLGLADRSIQERTLLFYLEQTDESMAHFKQDLEARTKLFRCLGMTAGLFLMVLLA